MPNLLKITLEPAPKILSNQERFEDRLKSLGILPGAMAISSTDNKYVNEHINYLWTMFKIKNFLE